MTEEVKEETKRTPEENAGNKENEKNPLKEEKKTDDVVEINKGENEEEENIILGLPSWKLFIIVFIIITIVWMILAIALGVGLR